MVDNGNIYDDWFLPSKDELNQMYVNLKSEGVGGFGPYYWSSSERNSDTTYVHYFNSGGQDYDLKHYTDYGVRAVRVF